jgi:hypothetical protein
MVLLLPLSRSWLVVALAQSSLGMHFQDLHLLVKVLAATRAQVDCDEGGPERIWKVW